MRVNNHIKRQRSSDWNRKQDPDWNKKQNVVYKGTLGNSLAVQWLGLCAFTAEGAGSVPGWRTKIPQATRHSQKKKKKKKGTLDSSHNDKRVNPAERYDNYKYTCT